MGWGDDLLDFAGKVGKGVIQAADDVVSFPGQVFHEYADAKPVPEEYQGAPGRRHNNATVIKGGSANRNDNERPVYLACRVVGGGFAGETLGMFQKVASDYLVPVPAFAPNPLHHWCITVGDYLHQLQATSLDAGWNYYTNERINRLTGGWTFFPIGATTFNDEAIRDESTKVMNDMPEIYNAWHNNCQTFSLQLVDRILTKARVKKFLKADMTFGQMKAPELTLDMLPRTVVTRIDTGEVVEPADMEVAIEPVVVEEIAAAEAEPLILEELKVEPVEIPAAAEKNEEAEEEVSDISRADMLQNVAIIMIQNTPTLSKEEVVGGATP